MESDAAILALNSGSSSLKFALFAATANDDTPLLKGSADGIGRGDGKLHIEDAQGNVLADEQHISETQAEALEKISHVLSRCGHALPLVVGHRVVHGGPHLRVHQEITAAVLAQLRAAVHFAPLHVPAAIALIEQAEKTFPDAKQFACFDTAFHSTLPESAAHLPLPEKYWQQGVRKYGFHGLSYESIVYRLGNAVPARCVFAHLGSGASVAAVRDGRSVETSMGLTPTGGIVMGTRTGDLDPGVMLYLMRTEMLDADALEKLVNKESGLAGLSGGESDMQALLQRAAEADAVAALAVEVFCMRARMTIGAYIALLGGIELLVFTGGIGEHSAEVRGRITAGLEALGVTADKVQVMPAQEELQIARHCREFLGAA